MNKNYYKFTEKMMNDTDITMLEVRILFIIQDYQHIVETTGKMPDFKLTNEYLWTKLGVSRSTIIRLLRRLFKEGYIRKEKTGKGRYLVFN